MFKYYTVARETNDLIEEFNTEAEAKAAIAAYEEEDKKDGTYEEDFYDVLEVEYMSLV